MASEESELLEIKTKIVAMQESIEKLEVLIEPILSCNIDEVVSQLPDLEAAKLHAAIAYALNTVYFMYVRVQGVHHSSHKIMDELNRVKASIGNLTKVAKKLEERKKADEEAAAAKEQQQKDKESQRAGEASKTVVNQDAAERIVRHALKEGKSQGKKNRK